MDDPKRTMGAALAYGIAFDIGTTTVAGYLVDLKSDGRSPPHIIASAARLNGQGIFGADEFSRVEYASRTNRGIDELSRLIRADIVAIGDELLARSKVGKESLSVIAAVGSAAMLRLFAARHPSRGPYDSLECESVEAASFGLPYPRCTLILAPSAPLGAGADLLAAIRVAGLEERDGPTLLLDFGSKGSAALGDRHGIVCCASPAGPPYEGPSFSCGTGGLSGAVDSISWSDGRLRWTTLGGAEAIGLCASGVIDAAACLVRASVVEANGALEERWWSSGYPLLRTKSAEFRFTQADLRHIQLAKASLAACAAMLLAERGIAYDEVDRILLSGSFGGKISPASAAVIGLFPKATLGRTESIGNASGLGAVRLLTDEDEAGRLEALARRCTALDISTVKGFDTRFSAELLFPAAGSVLDAVVPAAP